MNMISSLIAKESLSFNDTLNILWLPIDNSRFVEFISKLDHKMIEIKDLYYGWCVPNIVICNNKIFQYEQALDLSVRYHIPVLIVDHNKKNQMLDSQKIQIINDLPSSYSIALNKDIHVSWDKIHDQILDFNIKDHTSLDTWNNLLHHLVKRIYVL